MGAMITQESNRRLDSVLAEYDFNNQNPTLRQLVDLHRALNKECVQRSSPTGTPDLDLAYGTIIQFTVYLSSQLLQCDGPNSDTFRETQLRALVAAFALLLHSEITKLTPPRYDELRTNIAGRFSDIVKVPTSDLQSRMRKANALFLIRLAAQYFSLIKRAEPLTDVLVPSILGLVLVGASVASGQYTGLHGVFRVANQLIGAIPGRESQYLNLPALQEITRRATVSFREGDDAIEDSSDGEAAGPATNDVELVQELLKTYLEEIPSRRRDSWNWPLTQLGLGPPSLNKWYFFYGLLDCAAQLLRYLQPEQVPIRLRRTFAEIVQKSEFEEFRWKIIEIFLVCLRPRIRSQSLRESLRTSFGLERPLDISESEAEVMAKILEEDVIGSASAVNAELDPMTGQQGLRQVSTSESSNSANTSSGRTSSMNMQRVSTSNSSAILDRIESCPLQNNPTNTGYTDRQESHSSLIESQLTLSSSSNGEELSLAPYLTDELASWEPDGEAQAHRMMKSSGLFHKGYSQAGLSSACTKVYFQNTVKVSVYPVNARSEGVSASGWPLEWKYDKENLVVNVSLSEMVVAISTRKALELRLLRSSPANPQRPRIISHEDWDSSGLTIYEHGSEVLIAIGYRRETGTSRKGHVIIYRSKICSNGLERETIAHSFDIPRKDFPKCLQFDDQGEQLSCVTAIRNSVLIWHLGEPDPCQITKYHLRPETDSDGITSAVIYRSPNQQPYVLCSTSASTERYRSGGEWPFISPISTGGGQVPQSVVHSLVAMKSQRQLVAGAVSSKANIYAMLDKAGKVLILRLASHEDGGIHSRNVRPFTLQASLCSLRSSSASSTCLRFDPAGTKLYGVDPEGNLLIASFKPES